MLPRGRASRRLRLVPLTGLVVSLLAVNGVLGPRPVVAASTGFVSADGPALELDGLPWHFTGYDMYELPSVAVGTGFNCGGQYDEQWLDQTLDAIESDSDSPVIRTWFFQSYSGDDFVQFDTVLAAAAARNIKVIPVLVNQWGDCEPTVDGANDYKALAWYQGGYKVAGDGYPLSFRDYAVAMAARYADNPTIAFWQLVNEAEAAPTYGEPCDETAAAQAIRGFADDMVSAMKAVDPNHLISLGTIGTGQCGTSGTDYEYVHAGLVDICEYHDYTAGAITGDPWNGVADDLSGCAQLGKPTFAGEVGIDASVDSNWNATGVVTAQSLQQRAAFFAEKLQAQFNAGVSGFLVWSRAVGDSEGYDVAAGDPTTAILDAYQHELNAEDGRADTPQVVTGGDPGVSLGTPGSAIPSSVAAAGGHTSPADLAPRSATVPERSAATPIAVPWLIPWRAPHRR